MIASSVSSYFTYFLTSSTFGALFGTNDFAPPGTNATAFLASIFFSSTFGAYRSAHPFTGGKATGFATGAVEVPVG